MAVVDSKGRLFGKVSILDLGAALVILLVLFGIFIFPGTSGSVAQVNIPTKPVEIEVVVRVAGQNTESLFKPGEKTSIIIRNQPSGEITVKEVKELPDNVFVPQPDGKVQVIPDPRPESKLSRNLLLTLQGNAQVTEKGLVLGGNKMKIGAPIELEGINYSFTNLNVRDVRIQG